MSPPLISNNSSFFGNATLFANATALADNVCYGEDQKDACEAGGGSCDVITEGFYYLSIACFIIGALWFIWGFKTLRRLQEIDVLEWRVIKSGDEEPENKNPFKKAWDSLKKAIC